MTSHTLAKKAACLTSLKTPESKSICVRRNKSYRSSFFLTPLSSNLYKRHWSFREDFMKQNVQKETSKARDVKGKSTKIRNTFNREVLQKYVWQSITTLITNLWGKLGRINSSPGSSFLTGTEAISQLLLQSVFHFISEITKPDLLIKQRKLSLSIAFSAFHKYDKWLSRLN